jgi:hypothetical protein
MSDYEPWSECDDDTAVQPPPPPQPSSSSSLCQQLPSPHSSIDTSRLTDPFSKLFFYETTEERTHGCIAIVSMLYDIFLSFVDQRIRPELVNHLQHISHLNDMDILHLTFFFLLFTHTGIVKKVAAMTDTFRFCRFAQWLIPVIEKNHMNLSSQNARLLVHSIRFQWACMT